MTSPTYTSTTATEAVTGVPGAAARADRVDPAGAHRGQDWAEEWLSRRRESPRLIQTGLDLTAIGLIAFTFVDRTSSPEFLFHVVFVLLALHAFLFGLRGTLLRVAIVSVSVLAYANIGAVGSNEAPLDLTEWPLMFVIAVLVAWMADRRETTSRRYAGLFRRASDRLLTVQEDERRRIARELHDGVGQIVTALTLTLDAASSAPDGIVARRRLGSARELAVRALAETRDLADRMRPVRLGEIGLAAALRDLAKRAGFPVKVHVESAATGRGLLTPTATGEVYRIVQEALANSARHSGAPQAEVWLARPNGRLRVVVSDHGRGFDPSVSREAGIGLAGMQERATLLGARLAIRSAPGQGTRLTLDVPLSGPAGSVS